jgi:WD40 repeat protein
MTRPAYRQSFPLLAFITLLAAAAAACQFMTTVSTLASPTATPLPATLTPSPTPDSRIIDMRNVTSLTKISSTTQSWANDIDWSPDNSTLAIADMDGAWYRDSRSLKLLQYIDFTEALSPAIAGSAVDAIAYSPNADLIATSMSGNVSHILLWKPDGKKPIRRLLGHSDMVRDLLFSPDGKKIISASHDKTVKVWDVEVGNILCDLQNHWDWVVKLDLSEDGTRLVSAGYDGIINLWDPNTCELLVALQDDDIPDSVAISPDASLIAVGERDAAIHLFNDNGDLLRLLVGHEGWSIYDLDFSERGDILVSAGDDGTVRFWDPLTGTLLNTLEIGSEVNNVRFSPDGHSLVIASGMDQLVEIWGLPDP